MKLQRFSKYSITAIIFYLTVDRNVHSGFSEMQCTF